MKEKQKILLLGKLPPPYMGPAIATKILLDSGLKEYFTLLHLDTRTYDSLNELGKWKWKKLFRNFSLYRKFLKICRREQPGLVLVPISQATPGFLKDSVFILLGILRGRKVLLQLRGSDFENWILKSSALTRWYVKYVLKKAKGIIVLGETLRKLFQDYFMPDQIFVVPNGADLPLSFRVKDHAPIKILYLGNLQESKGIEDVLEAIALLQDRSLPAFGLDVVGTWRSESMRIRCEKKTAGGNLPVTVHPAAGGEVKFAYYRDADIFVFTPRAPEGHPWVMVESMAAGLPVISTDQGAIAECIIDGRNGYIVPSHSPRDIADRLHKLIADPALREKMGRESRKLYEEKFTEQQMVNRMKHAFDSVLAC